MQHVLRGAHLVPRHHGPVRVAEQARVHPREVAEVGEVLHLAGRVAGPPVWARGEHRPGAVLQFGHLGQRPARLVQGHPDQPVPFLAVERRDLRLGRHPARVLELRDSDAPAVGPVPPAVVRADQLVAVDPAQRQRGTAMHAQVLAGPRLAAGAAPQHQWLAEQIGVGGLSVSSAPNATGCQQLRSALGSAKAAGPVMLIRVRRRPVRSAAGSGAPGTGWTRSGSAC